ncbi:class E sortase [Paenibacillus sp. TRM 82003]|uniref:class E sortase n=1 Tax=Kineococcus sp. TRM81007 TaxID=2925831 RepID=UPI001F588A90|nr:class E sortase [Kineococcus sp. TRM81007]MCI2240564.1 class E sortase [Kineococcus sp. TRM81007]MCI3918943.1 class E sortase [Paenibacillus sp. TRM 82003]
MIRRAVGVTGELLVTAGVLVLLFVVWQLHWTDLTSERAQAAAVDALQERWDTAPAPTARAAAPTAPAAPAVPDVDQTPPTGDAFAITYVPRFGSDYAVPVVEGIGAEELEDGIGHYPGTAMPGGVGNFAIAGHRVTYGKPFHRVAELQEGDAVVVATADRWYTYRVRRHRIVTPQQVEIIAPVPDRPGEQPTEAWLTMTACHPMYSARERYIVYAQLESSQDRADGPPASLAAVG